MDATPRSWRDGAPYVVALVLAVVLVVVTVSRGGETKAAQEALGDQQLKIMAPADPGGGWDGTARAMQDALEDIVGRSEVYNVGGAGGTIGLSQFAQLDGQANQLMVMGLVMVGAIAANKPEVTLAKVTPIAELTTEDELIVVPADSEIQDVAGLVDALQADVGSVSWAGGSAGGAEQILAGLIATSLGLKGGDINYIAHSGGGEAVSTLLSGSATVGVSGVSEFASLIDSGKLRAIAVAGPERNAQLPDVPTLEESGVDVELTNWRGVVAPPGISAAQRGALEDVVTQMIDSDSWSDSLKREGWTDAGTGSDEFGAFLTSEQERVDQIVSELGIGKVS